MSSATILLSALRVNFEIKNPHTQEKDFHQKRM